MLRYFVASQLWLLFALLLVLGGGNAHVNPTYYSIFGIGFISPVTYWFVIGVCCLLSFGCFLKHSPR